MIYLQVANDGIITDCIDYAHEGYALHEGVVPNSVHGGWYKLIDGVIVEQVELNPTTIENQINAAVDAYTLELIETGVLA